METSKTCAHCGSAVAEDRVRRDFDGFCPGCLVREADLEFPGPGRGSLFTLGRYRAIRLLGRGGMGAVYEAVDESTGRTVALKVLTPTLISGTGERGLDEARFLEEARLCAAVGRHPNLASVQDAGIQDGRRFIAMELVRGTPLAEWARRSDVSPADRVAALRDVLHAVHHLHERGIIHGDLKPSNVIVDASGVARLVDFGIARRTVDDERPARTRTGPFVGTPLSMNPQQGMGGVDRGTDISSAGAILHELLTEPPLHSGGSTMEVLHKAAPSPGVEPSGTGIVDTELDRICLRALARDSGARYATAEAFAHELSQWLRRNGPGRGALRRSARLPVVMLALLAGTAALGVAVTLIPRRVPPSTSQAASAAPGVEPTALPTREVRTLRGHRGQVVNVAFSPNGSTLSSSGIDGAVFLWDVPTGLLRHSLTGHGEGWVRGLAWSPQGGLLASGGQKDRRIRFWNPRTGEQERELVQPSDDSAGCLAFHPSRNLLASSSESEGRGRVHLWDLDGNTIRGTLSAHEQSLLRIAFSPGGQHLASGSLDHTVRLWDVESGRQIWSLRPGCPWAGDSVEFSPDGRWVASEREDTVLALWEASTGNLVKVFEGHGKHINDVAFSADGSWIASGSSDMTIRIWSTATGRCLRVLEGHRGWVRSLDVSKDGLRLASGSADGTVRIWGIPEASLSK